MGGPNKKTYKTHNFKKLLLNVRSLTLEEQKAAIEKSFGDWKGECDQVDDVLVFGLKI